MSTSPGGLVTLGPPPPPVGAASPGGSRRLPPCERCRVFAAAGCGSLKLAGNGSLPRLLASAAT
eukprot:2482680-Pleurochrysis_carterae.AAC.1